MARAASGLPACPAHVQRRLISGLGTWQIAFAFFERANQVVPAKAAEHLRVLGDVIGVTWLMKPFRKAGTDFMPLIRPCDPARDLLQHIFRCMVFWCRRVNTRCGCGEIGIRGGLKIRWGFPRCRFESDQPHHFVYSSLPTSTGQAPGFVLQYNSDAFSPGEASDA
jgi:hypothetical protein